MKKTYEAPSWQVLSMGLQLRGKPVFIEFANGAENPVMKKSRFTTEDADLQRAIQGTKHFILGKIKCITSPVKEQISKTVYDVGGDKPKPLDLKEDQSVKVLKYKSWQQIADYLVKHKGIDASSVSNPGDISKVAERLNISIPNVG